jgi:hypothetical protein
MRIRFEEVKVKGVRRWVDGEGKKRQQTRTFSQTINPFNKLPDGTIKDRGTIYKEICAERNAWMKAGPVNGNG